MNWMEVAWFRNPSAAGPSRQRLEQWGVPARICRDSWLQRLWFVPKNHAGACLEVPVEQFEHAKKLLLEWDASEDFLRDAVRCPECRSLRVEYPQVARHSLLTNFFVGLAAEIGLVEKDYYCEKCHFTWPKKGTRPRRDRPHSAPYYFIDGIEQTTLASPSQDQQKAA